MILEAVTWSLWHKRHHAKEVFPVHFAGKCSGFWPSFSSVWFSLTDLPRQSPQATLKACLLQSTWNVGVTGSYRTQTCKCLPFLRLFTSQKLILQIYPQLSLFKREKIQVLMHSIASASTTIIQKKYAVFLNVDQYKFKIHLGTRENGIASGNLGIIGLALSHNYKLQCVD